MSSSPHLRDFGGSPAEDRIRAFRCDFLRGIPELPALTESEWRKKDEFSRTAYAEAVLWHHFFGRQEFKLLDETARCQPFGTETPDLRTLLMWRGAVALYPTCGEKTVRLRYLYLFRPSGNGSWSDHRSLLCSKERIGQDVLIYITEDFSPLKENQDGDSWQLAYRMAWRALDSSPEVRERLATKYLLTGAVVSGGTLEKVKIEGKTSLLKKYENITFLVPEKNRSDLNGLSKNRYHTVADTDQAWRFISGSGFEKNEILLPDPVKELHILVGGSLQPVLVVILLLNPEKVFLWRSDATAQQAETIMSVLKQARSRFDELHFELGIMSMDSHDLQQAYSDLDRTLKSKADRSQLVISNTGGNRLMGFAALLIAQTYGIPAVYRDINAEKDCLTGIQFRNEQRLTSDIRVNRCPVEGAVNWDWLYSKQQQESDLFRQLFRLG